MSEELSSFWSITRWSTVTAGILAALLIFTGNAGSTPGMAPTSTPAQGNAWGFMAQDAPTPAAELLPAPTPATQDSAWSFMTQDTPVPTLTPTVEVLPAATPAQGNAWGFMAQDAPTPAAELLPAPTPATQDSAWSFMTQDTPVPTLTPAVELLPAATPATQDSAWGFMTQDAPAPMPAVELLPAATPATQDNAWGFMTQDTPMPQPAAEPEHDVPTQTGSGLGTVILRRYKDQTEQAFSILVPDGWKTQGGILRINPLTQNGPGNSIAAKLDFAVMKDDRRSVMLYFVPEMLYCDPAKLLTTQYGFNQVGTYYKGMLLLPLPSAHVYLTQMLFAQLHPQASQVQVFDQTALPQLAQQYWQRQQQTFPLQNTFSYDAGMTTLTYIEDGITYKEKLFTVIEDYGELGVGMWDNKETIVMRAPIAEFDLWEPLLVTVQDSYRVDPLWMAMEIQGQIQRGEMAWKSQQDINRIAQEIVDHRRETYAEIRNDMYLTLTNQEEYINPYSNEVETGTNQYQNRWQNSLGDVIYTDDRDYDPNWDNTLALVKDFKQSTVRPRGPVQ